jgi:hypothetical protein
VDASDGAAAWAFDALDGDRFSEIGCLRKLRGRCARGALGAAVGAPDASEGAASGVSSGALGALDGARFSEIGCFKNSNMMATRATRAQGAKPTDLIDHSPRGH